MKIHQVTLVLVVSGLAAVPCSAQNMKPGLWEINTQVRSAGGEMERAMAQMQEELARMPPEQRRMVEQSMARQGVSVDKNGSGMKARICISKEMAERNRVPVQRQGNCTEKHGPVINGKMKSSFTCTNPPSSGEAEFTFTGDSAYTMAMQSRTTVDGRQQDMSMQANGRWVAADCGAVRPLPVR